MTVKVGDAAPDFELTNHLGERVRLSNFRDRKHVVIAFHPLAFTPVCQVQVSNYEKDRDKLSGLDAHVVIISNDSVPCKAAWAESMGGVSWDLLSDFHPNGDVARKYGVFRHDGISERALFVVDKDGRIVYAHVHAIPEQPDNQVVLDVLKRLDR